MYINNSPDEATDDVGRIQTAILDGLGRLIITTNEGCTVIIDQDTDELQLVRNALT